MLSSLLLHVQPSRVTVRALRFSTTLGLGLVELLPLRHPHPHRSRPDALLRAPSRRRLPQHAGPRARGDLRYAAPQCPSVGRPRHGGHGLPPPVSGLLHGVLQGHRGSSTGWWEWRSSSSPSPCRSRGISCRGTSSRSGPSPWGRASWRTPRSSARGSASFSSVGTILARPLCCGSTSCTAWSFRRSWRVSWPFTSGGCARTAAWRPRQAMDGDESRPGRISSSGSSRVLVLVVAAVNGAALFFDAPLEAPADPTRTPNPGPGAVVLPRPPGARALRRPPRGRRGPRGTRPGSHWGCPTSTASRVGVGAWFARERRVANGSSPSSLWPWSFSRSSARSSVAPTGPGCGHGHRDPEPRQAVERSGLRATVAGGARRSASVAVALLVTTLGAFWHEYRAEWRVVAAGRGGLGPEGSERRARRPRPSPDLAPRHRPGGPLHELSPRDGGRGPECRAVWRSREKPRRGGLVGVADAAPTEAAIRSAPSRRVARGASRRPLRLHAVPRWRGGGHEPSRGGASRLAPCPRAHGLPRAHGGPLRDLPPRAPAARGRDSRREGAPASPSSTASPATRSRASTLVR